MAGRPFVCRPGTPWPQRLLKWAAWYGVQPGCPASTRRYMLQRMLAEVPLTSTDVAFVRRIYAVASEMGKEVDHIWPLSTGGLHVPGNLEVISVTAHAAKTRGSDHNRELLDDDPVDGQMWIFK